MKNHEDIWRYRISGLDVVSEAKLPGAIPIAQSPAAPDVRIRRGLVPLGLADILASGPNWAMNTSSFLLRVPRIARFLMSEGQELLFMAETGVDERDTLGFLLGSAFGILLHQRGLMVLSASAIVVEGHAILFCGPSGAGKSTLACSLTLAGFPLLADDISVIAFNRDGSPLASGDGHLLKLWTNSIDQLDLGSELRVRVRSGIEKYYVTPSSEAITGPLPVGAIYVLREANGPDKPGIERMTLVDATAIVGRSAFRTHVVQCMKQQPLQFHHAVALAQRIGVFWLTRRWSLKENREVLSWLNGHLPRLGLGVVQ